MKKRKPAGSRTSLPGTTMTDEQADERQLLALKKAELSQNRDEFGAFLT